MVAFRLPVLKPLWFRFWIVTSVAWAAVFTWNLLPVSVAEPSMVVLESMMQTSVTDLRRRCTRYNLSVGVQMPEGYHRLCFRSEGERDVYFKWFSKASERYKRETKRTEISKQIVRGLGGFFIFALILLATDWILRAAGNGFLFIERSTSQKASEKGIALSNINLQLFLDAIPICLLVGTIWLALPLLAHWATIWQGLEAYGPEAAGTFFLSGFVVLLYRKTLHPLVTMSALLIYIPPAALLLYLPLHSNGFDFILIPFGIGCVEFSRYACSKLQPPSEQYARFGWQFIIFTASYFFTMILFSVLVYI